MRINKITAIYLSILFAVTSLAFLKLYFAEYTAKPASNVMDDKGSFPEIGPVQPISETLSKARSDLKQAL